MDVLIIKIVACSSLLFLFYDFFLAKERTFQFNRIYLVASLIFAYSVPFINFSFLTADKTHGNLLFGEMIPDFQPVKNVPVQTIGIVNVLGVIYVVVSSVLFIKFIHSLRKVIALKGEQKIYRNQKIKIVGGNGAPFSFLNTIYISKKYWVDGEIDERIFLHEKCHTQSKHSCDILFLELLKIFSWFNPVLFFYRKAMINNHEFLADEYVLENNFEIKKVPAFNFK